jgi:hypothetical protein
MWLKFISNFKMLDLVLDRVYLDSYLVSSYPPNRIVGQHWCKHDMVKKKKQKKTNGKKLYQYSCSNCMNNYGQK